MNDFERDKEFERWCRDNILFWFHLASSLDGRFVFVDKSRCSTILQKRFAVDTIAQRRDGGSIMIEEKMTRYPRRGGELPNFFFETESCTVVGRETPGWMVYGEADCLLYGFQLEPHPSEHFRLYLIDFQRLKEWFWPRAEEFRRYVMPNTVNHTAGRLVPIRRVESDVGFRAFETPLKSEAA